MRRGGIPENNLGVTQSATVLPARQSGTIPMPDRAPVPFPCIFAARLSAQLPQPVAWKRYVVSVVRCADQPLHCRLPPSRSDEAGSFTPSPPRRNPARAPDIPLAALRDGQSGAGGDTIHRAASVVVARPVIHDGFFSAYVMGDGIRAVVVHGYHAVECRRSVGSFSPHTPWLSGNAAEPGGSLSPSRRR